MIKKTSLAIFFLSISFALNTLSIAQTVDSPMNAYRNEIRRMHNDSSDSYKDLQTKIREQAKNKHYAKIKEKIERYYNAAVILEKQGKYTQASEFYGKVLLLTNDPDLKKYIEEKNAELKLLAEENRRLAAEHLNQIKIREQERKRLQKMQLKDEIKRMRSKLNN